MDRIVFEGVGKRYGKQWALRAVNARFAQGEVVMVIGPNGSGKTTLIKCLLGLVRATEGGIHVNGTVVGEDPSYRTSIGYMPQYAEFPKELSVDQLLRMMNDIRDAKSGSTDDRLIGLLGVDALLDKRISTLSGGMRQKVSAVLAFRYRPNILILDEPTAGLDPVSANKLLDAVMHAKRNGATVLITSHIMEEVQRLGDRVAYLQDGRLRFALPPETIIGATGEASLSLALPKYLAQLPPTHVEKVYKYTLLDLARNRFALGYALLLLLLSVGLFMLESDNTKTLISLTQVMLALVPLLALVFTIIYFYNQYEFTVLLAVQPLRRQSITRAQFFAVGTALLISFLFGVGLPVAAYAPGPIGWTLLLTGSALTVVFCAMGMFIAVRQNDRAKAVGIGLATWVFLVLVYDSLLLWLMFSFSDRPIEPLIVPLAALNPIDLSRILIMLKIDLAALLGYTGAVYQQFFGSLGGMVVSFIALLLWMLLPMWGAVRTFARKDL